MATTSTSCFWLVAMFVCLGSVLSAESSEISQSETSNHPHHQAQKRSAAMLEPVDSGYPGVDMDQVYPDSTSLLEGPYDDQPMDKRTLFRFGKRGGSILRYGKRGSGTLFRFGKRGSGTLFRFGKRGNLFRFGKRGGSLFRFGKRGGAEEWDGSETEKRNSLFRFGKRADDLEKRNSLFRFGKRADDLEKRNSLFRFGKRADDSDNVLDDLDSYYGLSDDVDSKRNVNSFHWGNSEK